MRISLDKQSRKMLFEELKRIHNTFSYSRLAKKIGVSFGCLKGWLYGENYIPHKIIPKKFLDKLNIIDLKNDGWGAKKGGKIGIKKVREKYGIKMREWQRRGGTNASSKLNSWKELHKREHNLSVKIGKFKKTVERIETETKKHKEFFNKNTHIKFDLRKIEKSSFDIKRKIVLPETLTEELAEEIGIHAGDGTLPKKRYYFSVRGDKKEKEYYTNHVLPLYKKLYNLDLKLLWRGSVCGFEISSKALYQFKSQIIKLPIGKKVGKVDVPPCIMECRDKKIIRAFLRGVLDTDGNVYFLKKRGYPVISIKIKSENFIKNASELLRKLGFIPSVNPYVIILNGPIMFKKWVEEIGSNNPKHIKKIKFIWKKLPWSSLDKVFQKRHNPAVE